jgi:hypothetical protein
VLLQVQEGIVKIGGPCSLIVRLNFNALPPTVSWALEEPANGSESAEAAPAAAEAPAKQTTHEIDVLKRIDIYGCT